MKELEKAAKEPDDAKAAIAGYLLSRLAGSTDAELDEGYWGLLNLAERFIIQGGVANFPDAVGCEQKSAAVNAAYESEDPAARAAIKAIKADLDEAAAMLKDKTALEHVVDITELLTQARAAFDTIGQTAQSGTVKQLKEKYNTLLNETVALLETSAADLMSRAMNLTDTSQVGWLLDSMDDLQALINALPAGTADKEQLQSLLTQARGILEQQSLGMTEDLLEQITAIYEQLQNTESIPKIRSLINDLIAIGVHLVEVADAVYNLPEYEEAMDTFKLTTEYSMGLLEARVAELEYQTAQLTAKSIDVSASAKVTFPKNKAKLTISWATDADATGGYKVLFNGKEVTPAESEGVMTYEVNNVEIGKTYEYAITPSYQDAKTGKLYEGKTFKGTVVPKVTVKKTSIRKLTKGKRSFTVTWKKVSGATGYQIYYKTGKAKAVTKNVGAKGLSKKIKGLKKGKVYTVKVRALKTVNDKKYYGAWSAAKKVRTK